MTATTYDVAAMERRTIKPAGMTAILDALRSVLPQSSDIIALHEPSFTGHEWDYVKETLDTGWVSYAGPHVKRFETILAECCEARHTIAVVNGTVALQIALTLCGVRQNDEVLLPALTFVATANAVVHCGAIPHLIDSETTSLGMCATRLAAHLAEISEMRDGECFNRATGRRIAALMPMHTFGHPVDMDAIIALAERYNLPVVEDATESLGSRYKGRATGGLGRVGAMSFNGNKIVTTGGGGAIITNDDALAAAARHLTTTAKMPHRWAFNHDQVGYNFRLPSLNAALGCAQLEQLPRFIVAKRRLAAQYRAAFEGVSGVSFFSEPAYAESNYWLNALLLKPTHASDMTARDALLSMTNDAGIMTRPVWTLMHRLPMYANCPRMDLSVAEDLERRLINIPSSARLSGNT